MNITLHLWMLPVALTVFIWAVAFAWPLPRRRGDYDFGAVIMGSFYTLFAIIVTLIVWLIYFAYLAWRNV